MSDGGVSSGFYRPKFYDQVNNSLTASTDVVTRFGTVRICWHDETVINIVLGPFDPDDRRTSVRRFLPPHPEGQQLIARLMRYFMGKSAEFDVPLPPDVGTDFHRTVWAGLRDIPYGTCQTYGALALRLGLPAGRARTVGSTVAQNPLPILYPCHRVVAATGALTGYSAGPQWKKALLEHEGVTVRNDRVAVDEQP